MQPTRFGGLYTRIMGTAELAIRVRTRHLLKEIRSARPRTLLDVGCGAGFLSIPAALGDARMTVLGVDRNEEQVNRAREIARRLGSTNVSFQLMDVADISGEFACVVCSDVIHGADAWKDVLRHVAERVAAGGLLLIHSPDPRGRFLRPFREANLGLEVDDVLGELRLFRVLRVARTMRLMPEFAFELSHPDHGLIRDRRLRALAMPVLAAATRLDWGPGGAAWLASLQRER
jgi:2-polyprenyl-3-methyl-5-hydroxy-6-metoxy-1,4-benzoquinol methylase